MTEYIVVDAHNNWLATGDFINLTAAYNKAKRANNYEKGIELYAFELKSLIPASNCYTMNMEE